MFYICVICDCVCVLKYAIYLIWPRQFSFGPDSSHLAHVFLIWLIPWPEQKMSQRGPCYPYNGRADKNPYPHDRHADKDSYSHDSNNQCIILRLQLSFLMIIVHLMRV